MFQTLFYQPILNLLICLYNIVPGNDFGVAIIALTIIIKLILLPLSKKSLKSQKALQDLQPKVEELKKKYSKNKEKLGRAMMKLYKENKVNPLSSCLPLLIQMPFLYAVFWVFRDGFDNGSLDLVYSFISRPESIDTVSLGFIDLAKKNPTIAILAGAAQYWQSKMLMAKRPKAKNNIVKKAGDMDMAAIMNKQMIYFMPIITVFIGMSFPGGLALYWLVTTVLTGVQQLFIFKKKEKKDDIIEAEVVKK